jgi:hypothetical protein
MQNWLLALLLFLPSLQIQSTSSHTGCSNAFLKIQGHLNIMTVWDRLQSLNQFSLSLSHDGSISVIDGEVTSRRSITVGDLWQAMLCSTVPDFTYSMLFQVDTDPSNIQASRFTVKVLDDRYINVSIVSSVINRVCVIPNLPHLSSATITFVARVTSASLQDELTALSFEGIWHLENVMVPVFIKWLGLRLVLSMPKTSLGTVVISFLKNTDNDLVLSTIQPILGEGKTVDLQVALGLKVGIMNGKNMFTISAKGKKISTNYMTVTHLVRLVPFLFKSGITTPKTVWDTPTTGRTSYFRVLSHNSAGTSTGFIYQARKDKALKHQSDVKRSAIEHENIIHVEQLHYSQSQLTRIIETSTKINISKFPAITALDTFRGFLINSSTHFSHGDVTDMGFDDLVNQCGGISEGLSAIVSVDLLPRTPVVIQIRWDPKLEARVCKQNFTTKTFMSQLFPSILPSFLKLDHLDSFVISDLIPNLTVYDVSSNHVILSFRVNRVLQIIPDLAQVSINKFNIYVPLDDLRLPLFQASVDWELGQFRWQNVPFTLKTDGININWRGNRLNINEVLQKLNMSYLPSNLSAQLEQAGLLNFTIYDPIVRLNTNRHSSMFHLNLGGTTSFPVWGKVTFEGIVQSVDLGYALAIGLHIRDMSISGLLESLTGISFEKEPLMPASASVTLSVCNFELTTTNFEFQLLSHLRVIKGLSFVSEFKFPNCRGDSLCELANSGSTDDTLITLQGVVSSPCEFIVTASLENVAFGPIKIKNAHIDFTSKTPCASSLMYHVVIKGDIELAFRSHTLLFKTEIKKTSTDLEMVAFLNGWHYPFGLSWLGIGNGELRLKHAPQMPTLLRVSVDIQINGNKIGARVAFGIDLKNPRVGYICGEIETLTLESLLKSFNLWPANKTLLPAVSDIGFPSGLSLSYSTSTFDNGLQIPNICKSLHDGLALSGQFQFLGLDLYLEIKVNGQSLSAEASMEPIKFTNGSITVYKSRKDKTRGPALKITVERKPFVSVQVSIIGYIVLRHVMSKEAQITFTQSEVISEVTVNISSFLVSLKLYGPYHALLSQISFRRSAGSLEKISLKWIGGKLEELLRKLAKTATDFIAGLQRNLHSVKDAFQKGQKILSGKQRDVEAARRKLEGPLKKMKETQKEVENLCQIQNCSRSCLGCPGWNNCCEKVFRICVGCPIVLKCCTTVPNLKCVAKNTLCRTARVAAYAALEAAQVAYHAVLVPFDAAILALDKANKAVEAAKSLLDSAVNALETGKKAAAAGLELAANLAGRTVGEVIEVRSVDFDVDLRQLQKFRVEAGAVVILFGKEHDLRISFALNTKEIINAIVEKIKPGLLKILKLRRRRSLIANGSTPLPTFSLDTLKENSNSSSSSYHLHYLTKSDINLGITFARAEIDRLTRDRQDARHKTVDWLAHINTSQHVYATVLAQIETRTSETSPQVQAKVKARVIHGKCDVLMDLGRLIKNVWTSFKEVYAQWKYSFTLYTIEIAKHHSEAHFIETVRKKIRETAGNVTAFFFEKELREEDKLLQDMSQGIAQWDLSVRSQLLQIDRAGGKLFLSQTNQGFQQLAGLPLLQYIQENLKLLGDTPESQKMIMMLRGLGKKSLKKLALQLKTLLTNMKALKRRMNCTSRD